MLPWLFGILLVLNGALFYWGFQREKSQEPSPPALPQTSHEVRLASQTGAPRGEQPPREDAATRSGKRPEGGVSETEAGKPPLPPVQRVSGETAGAEAFGDVARATLSEPPAVSDAVHAEHPVPGSGSGKSTELPAGDAEAIADAAASGRAAAQPVVTDEEDLRSGDASERDGPGEDDINEHAETVKGSESPKVGGFSSDPAPTVRSDLSPADSDAAQSGPPASDGSNSDGLRPDEEDTNQRDIDARDPEPPLGPFPGIDTLPPDPLRPGPASGRMPANTG